MLCMVYIKDFFRKVDVDEKTKMDKFEKKNKAWDEGLFSFWNRDW